MLQSLHLKVERKSNKEKKEEEPREDISWLGLSMFNSQHTFKARVVQLILKRETEEALNALSENYHVDVPRLKVGMPKKHSRKVGCYVSKTKTIHVMSREKLEDPYLILHEFYHHLRTQDRRHRGTEKHADRFAEEFIEAFQAFKRYSFHVSY